MTASRIAPKLYQGSLPPSSALLRAQSIETIVLCAAELQPDDRQFGEGIEVLRCPFNDNQSLPSVATLDAIKRTASAVAARVRARKRVLVTCAQGRNRSGLVTALALTDLYGISGQEAVACVQRAREHALSNPLFTAILSGIPARAYATR